ncbi:MAG: hypothetical protein AUJ57_01420 [Zetaproteobacteria bacterium CG1_02_53_45]|nr:MAG: hypothetical protein AUJ57_01420 [Zetaproteobacteria bacterium CG1_02_53_45]
MDDHTEQQTDDNGVDGKHALHTHAKTHSAPESEREAVNRIRSRHKVKAGKAKKAPKRRMIFWAQVLIVVTIVVTAGLFIRAIELATSNSAGITWFDEIKHGNYDLAAEKFSITATAAASQAFTSEITTESLMRDFNAALPHLKTAGYTLTEMEVEVGIPPKLIPHFYHDPDVKLNLEKSLKGLGNNRLGAALIMALAEAGSLQKQIEVADMQFNHIEVELGLIPALRLQYKNDTGIKNYIHKGD